MKRRTDLSIRLVTINCYSIPFTDHPRARLLTLARELGRMSLDLICFQEVHLWRYADLLARALPAFPHRADWPYLYAPKGGLLTLSRHRIAHKRFVLYEKRGRAHTPGLADWLLHKGILITELQASGWPVVIANTHLLANYSANWSAENQYAQHQRSELEQLSRTVKDISRDKLLVLAGDFNIPTNSGLYRDFIRSTELVDPLAATAQPTFRPPWIFPSHYAQALDHVLIRAPEGVQARVAAGLVFDRPVRLVNGTKSFLSDHSGIELKVELALE